MVNVFPYGVVANQAYGTWNIISAWAECNQIRYHLKVLDFDFNFTSCMCLSCEQFFTSEIWHGPVKCLHCSVMDCNCFSNNTDFFVVVNNQVFGLGVIRKYWYFFKETKTVICLQPPPPSPPLRNECIQMMHGIDIFSTTISRTYMYVKISTQHVSHAVLYYRIMHATKAGTQRRRANSCENVGTLDLRAYRCLYAFWMCTVLHACMHACNVLGEGWCLG